IKGFIWVMDDQVFLFDRQKAIARIVSDALRKTRIVSLEFEVRPVEIDKFGELIEGKHTVEDIYLFADNIEFLGNETAQLVRHKTVDLEAYHRTAAAAL